MTGPISLSTNQFDAHWAALGLGRKPYPLDIAHSGRVVPPKSEVAALLQLLGDHVTAVDMVADVAGPMRAIAASNGRRGVLAAIRGEQMVLEPIRPTALAVSLLNVLPQGRAGSGRAMSVPLDVVRGAGHNSWGTEQSPHDVRQALVQAGLSRDDAALVSELAAGRTAGGQFGVTHGDVRAKTVITWFDTAKGRYLVVSDGGWLSIAPADSSRIANRVDSILAA